MKFKSDIEIQAGVEAGGSTGSNGQVLSSTGSGVAWTNQGDIIAGEAEVAKSLQVTVKNVSGGELTKGTVVHTAPTASPPSGNVIEVIAADYDDTTKMPAVGILKETIANEAEGEAVMTGTLSGIATDGFSVGDELYVGADGALTNVKPQTAGQLIQKIAVCVKSHASNGLIKIFGAGRSNDVPLPLYIDNTNQRLGIGAASPGSLLHIKGEDPILTIQDTSTGTANASSTLRLGESGAGSVLDVYWDIKQASDDLNTHLEINHSSNGNHFTILDNGKVGIGTDSPNTKLHIQNPTRIDDNYGLMLVENTATGDTSTTNTGINVKNYSGTSQFMQWEENGLRIGSRRVTNNGLGHVIFTAGEDLEKMRIQANGNVGIGTTGPLTKLDVRGSTFVSGYLAGFDTSPQGNYAYRLTNDGANSFINVLGGNVGIGTTNPSEKLDVAGNIIINSALLSNQENTNVDTGAEVVAQVSTSTYTAAFFDFVIKKVGNIRSGTVYACHDGTNVEFTETSTNDLGDTSDVTLSVDKSGTNLRLIATVTSDDWIIKSLIRGI